MKIFSALVYTCLLVFCLGMFAISAEQTPEATEAETAITIDSFVKNPQQFIGKIQLLGKVSKAVPARGALMLVPAKSCKSACGGCKVDRVNRVPIRVDMKNFDGSLPAEGETVVVEATIVTKGNGYTITVHRILRAGEAILTAK